jgi:hypothetical protein
MLSETLCRDTTQPADVHGLDLARKNQPIHQGPADTKTLSGFLDPKQEPWFLR